jgi:hypothetical protein
LYIIVCPIVFFLLAIVLFVLLLFKPPKFTLWLLQTILK